MESIISHKFIIFNIRIFDHPHQPVNSIYVDYLKKIIDVVILFITTGNNIIHVYIYNQEGHLSIYDRERRRESEREEEKRKDRSKSIVTIIIIV